MERRRGQKSVVANFLKEVLLLSFWKELLFRCIKVHVDRFLLSGLLEISWANRNKWRYEHNSLTGDSRYSRWVELFRTNLTNEKMHIWTLAPPKTLSGSNFFALFRPNINCTNECDLTLKFYRIKQKWLTSYIVFPRWSQFCFFWTTRSVLKIIRAVYC